MMQPVSVTLRRLDKNTIPELALIALWFAGLSLGLWAACRYGDAYASFLQPLAGHAPELGGVFASAIFPLLLSACAVAFFDTAGCFGMCLIRSLSQGFFLGLVRICYGTAAPLVALLLGFSAVLVNGVLLFCWLRWLRAGSVPYGELPAMLGLCVGIGAADYLLIGPFLADVINL